MNFWNWNHVLHSASAPELPTESTGLAFRQLLPVILFFVGLIFVFWLVLHLRGSARRKRLHQLTNYDVLTGLPNWEQLQIRMKKNRSGALAVFEIKFFKAYNELMGYEVGDRILKGVAHRLAASQQGYGVFAARMQSASFAVLLPAGTPEQLQKRLYSLLETVGKQDEEARWSIRFACGVARFGQGDTAADTLVSANFARQAAKESIGTEVVVFDTDTHNALAASISSTGQLVHGASTGDLVVAYQPKYNLQTGQPVGAEALIRWNHPQRGLLLPEQFLPVLEQTGSIKRVDLYVLRQVLWQISAWHKAGLAILPIAINLSRIQFTNPRLCEDLLAVCAEYGVSPSLLQLEFTEGAFLYDEEQVMALLQKLHAAGFTLALDDFGAGLSSLNHLRKMPLAALNLDRALIGDIETDQRQQLLVRDMVILAKDMGIITLLKGVETPAQASFARAAGCDLAQGFLFAKPAPADVFTALLAQAAAGTSPA